MSRSVIYGARLPLLNKAPKSASREKRIRRNAEKVEAAKFYVGYRARRTSKYMPHQGERECARRLRQMEAS